MVNIRIEKKPPFQVAGEKIWISGQDNKIFEAFWERAHESGLVARLKAISIKCGKPHNRQRCFRCFLRGKGSE